MRVHDSQGCSSLLLSFLDLDALSIFAHPRRLRVQDGGSANGQPAYSLFVEHCWLAPILNDYAHNFSLIPIRDWSAPKLEPARLEACL